MLRIKAGNLYLDVSKVGFRLASSMAPFGRWILKAAARRVCQFRLLRQTKLQLHAPASLPIITDFFGIFRNVSAEFVRSTHYGIRSWSSFLAAELHAKQGLAPLA